MALKKIKFFRFKIGKNEIRILLKKIKIIYK